MKTVKFMFIKGSFFFIIGVILATLFVWSMVEGVLSHMRGGEYTQFYYFASWLAGIGALTLYIQARQLIHYASISE